MVFSSLTFLFAYLPVVMLVYFISPLKYRNFILLLVSLFFYGWGEPIYIFIMIASIVVNWIFAFPINKYRDTNKDKAKIWLILCIVFNLSLLGFFKYWDFLAGFIPFIKPVGVSLPIGISFYTFQTMSYPIDLYRKETHIQNSLVNFGAYVSMFPQLIAGPIVRYVDIEKQLNNHPVTETRFYEGIQRFIIGLSKKVLLANNAGKVFEEISRLTIPNQSVASAWIGIIAYAFQIYFDFSGYSDMAIGLGKMLGFEFPENFNYPYIAKSITDFWRRWHMTLSYWFRDYVYIPLGGNRKGKKRQIINILIVWLLTGLWHGASWNFILWGLFYGIVLLFEKLFFKKYLDKLPDFFKHLYTIVIVLIAWVLFAFTDLSKGLHYLSLLFGGAKFINGYAIYFLRDNALLFLICFIASTPIAKTKFNFITKHEYLVPVCVLLLLFICTSFIVDASYNPFLYFRF